jgi:hypothetical protein
MTNTGRNMLYDEITYCNNCYVYTSNNITGTAFLLNCGKHSPNNAGSSLKTKILYFIFVTVLGSNIYSDKM